MSISCVVSFFSIPSWELCSLEMDDLKEEFVQANKVTHIKENSVSNHAHIQTLSWWVIQLRLYIVGLNVHHLD